MTLTFFSSSRWNPILLGCLARRESKSYDTVIVPWVWSLLVIFLTF